MLERKLNRDVIERGIDPETVKERFTQNVIPATKTFVQPQQMNAEYIIHNNA